MRLIDADATIKYLREFRCKDCDRRKGMKNGKIQFCYEIGDAPCKACDIGDTIDYFLDEDISPTIEAVPVKEQQKWISIKERYPDKEGFYLVSADHGNYLPWIAEMKIFCGVKGFCNGAAMPCVGAWMPLPEPYNRTD